VPGPVEVFLGVGSDIDAPPGIRGAGFFGMDWSVAAGEFAWRE